MRASIYFILCEIKLSQTSTDTIKEMLGVKIQKVSAFTRPLKEREKK